MPTPAADLTDWPRAPEDPQRRLCTSQRPMPMGAGGMWAHPEAKVVGGCREGCCDDYQCPACGTEWRHECPD